MALTKIDDRGLKTPIDLLDSEKIRFGTGNDLELYHDGSNSVIKNTTGDLIIEDTGGNLIFRPKTGEDAIKAYADGAVELYYDGSKKFETTNLGVKFSGYLQGNDGHHIRLGTSDDFNFYHSGNENIVDCANGHQLHLKYGSEHLAKFIPDGGVELYYDNSKKLETTSGGVKISDSTLEIADTTCLIDLMETGATDSNHRIRNGNGNFYIQKISDDKSTTTSQLVIDGGAGVVKLYHNGAGPKFETYSDGVKVTGVVRGTTSGFGIDFAETSNATGKTSEVLDDYEEGTWSPTIFGETTAGSYSYEAVRTGGRYTKIGNLVYIEGVLRISAINTAGAGHLHFGGLPFSLGSEPASSWSIGRGITIIHYGVGANSTATDNPPPFVGVGYNGASTIEMRGYGKNYNITPDITDFTAQYWIYQITGCYQV